MAKLPRVHQKIFAENAVSTEIGQFGSAVAGAKKETGDIAEIQELDAWGQGWSEANVSKNRYPALQEDNGVKKVVTQQLAYIFQEGIPEWNNKTEYNKGSIIKVVDGSKIKLYYSKQDGNIGHLITETDWWEELKIGGGGNELCDIGIALFVDESKGLRRYLNGSIMAITDNYLPFLNKLKTLKTQSPQLFTDEESWQSEYTLSHKGQVGKFVIADDESTVRLPRVINVQGVYDLLKCGLRVEAGLPNITGSIRAYVDLGAEGQDDANEALYTERTGTYYIGTQGAGGTTDRNRLSLDASRSSSVYGKSNTVQQEQIQYPYFIQVATGAETEDNIINEIELNNPFSLLDYKFSEYELNNLSWLRSQGQWNAKAVFTDAYDLLLKIYNGTETKAGVSVKLSTEDYTDYDFVLNTADETFRLPISVNNSAQGYLYFYVGETVQNANLINAGRIEEQLATKVDKFDAYKYSIPDYTNTIQVGSVNNSIAFTSYTAPVSGLLNLGWGAMINATNTIKILVNGHGVAWGYKTGVASFTTSFPVNAGDVVTWQLTTGTSGAPYVYGFLCPYKEGGN